MSILVASTEIQTAYMKIGLYGGPASGKTVTALKIATSLGNTAIIDTNREIEPLRDQYFNPDGSPIWVGPTRRTADMPEAIDEAVEKGCKCFIVDNISTLYDELQDDFIFREYEKQSKAWRFIEKNGQIPFQGWRFIKKPYKKMIWRLLNAPMHVFLLSRVVNEWQIQGDGEPTKTGERMNAERDTQYEPQILIKMEYRKRERKRYAYVERDRWKSGIEGETFIDPDVSMLGPVIARLGHIHRPLPPAAFDQDIVEPASGPKTSQVIVIKSLAKKGGIEDAVVEEALEAMTSEQAAIAINAMTLGNFESLTNLKKEE